MKLDKKLKGFLFDFYIEKLSSNFEEINFIKQRNLNLQFLVAKI